MSHSTPGMSVHTVAIAKIDRALLDWMEHGLHLKQAVLAKAGHYLKAGLFTRRDVARLKRDIVLRQRVLACIYQRQSLDPADLTPREAIWRDYMLAHAALQIARYGGELHEDDHTAHCNAIRLHRDERMQAI